MRLLYTWTDTDRHGQKGTGIDGSQVLSLASGRGDGQGLLSHILYWIRWCRQCRTDAHIYLFILSQVLFREQVINLLSRTH